MNNIKHLAIIMDGNGRWAKKQNMPRTYGHKVGTDNVRDIAIACNELEISVLTVYAFSTENWKRPEEEVKYLMNLPKFFFEKFMKEIMEKNIKIKLMGYWDGIPSNARSVFEKAVEKSKNNTGMILNFAMNYGSQQEIVDACKKYANDVVIDLMIRTSGEYRISNFLLFQLAYSELMFIDKAWPEFKKADLINCLNDFYNRDRRFGGLK